MDGRMNERTDGRTNEWTDGRTDEQMDEGTGGLLELLSQLKIDGAELGQAQLKLATQHS